MPVPKTFLVSTCLLFDNDDKLLVYLRDDNPAIPYPNCWDLFGGIVEDGETPEQALVREVKEELAITLTAFTKLREYDCTANSSRPNIKFVYYAKINIPASQLILQEGQQLKGINLQDYRQYNFANILTQVIEDFAAMNI